MSRNYVFVQRGIRGIRAVKLWQLSVGAFLRINTVIVLLGDVLRGNPWAVQAETEGCKVGKKFVGAWGVRISLFFHKTTSVYGGTYAVKLSITELIKISRKWRTRFNGRLWKMQMWSDSYSMQSYLRLREHWDLFPAAQTSRTTTGVGMTLKWRCKFFCPELTEQSFVTGCLLSATWES